MKLPPDLERKVLELAGEKPEPARRRRKAAPPELVTPGMVAPGVWLVAYEAVPEANKRQWQGRNRRAGAAWNAVRAAVRLADLQPYSDAPRVGRVVRVRFVRLGGRRLDPLVNLPSSLKGVEDAFAYLLGADDGSPWWRPTCAQEPGGRTGVRVKLSLDPAESR